MPQRTSCPGGDGAGVQGAARRAGVAEGSIRTGAWRRWPHVEAVENVAYVVVTAILVAVLALTPAYAGGPQPEPPKIEQAIKIKASGRMALCHTNVRVRRFLDLIDPQQEDELAGKCSAKLGSVFLKAELKCLASGVPGCTTNDAPIIAPRIQMLADRVAGFLAQEVVPGQRYVDNGDGTITDNQTGLQWEKKTDDASVHDKDNMYTWSATSGGDTPNGTAFTGFLNQLNNCSSGDGSTVTGGFAGHCDWRLPSVAELSGILLAPFPCGTTPCIDPVFGSTNSVAGGYWSATTDAVSSDYAWVVYFAVGGQDQDGKDSPNFARAVRGGF